MSDIAHGLIDKRIEQVERKLAKEYQTALRELKQKLNQYLTSFSKNDAKMRKDWLAGKISLKDYKDWRRNRILDAQRYNALIQELSQDLTNTNKIASDIINNSLASSYIDAANYTAYEIETAVGASEVSFTLYNKAAIGVLLEENPNLLPRPSVEVAKDLRWNMVKINSAIMQGILQGESIGKIANRLQAVTDMTRAAALRNARTLHTRVESQGREKRYEQAQDMGIEIAREWLAVHDNRTRDAHRELDGVIKPIGEPFENAIGKIRYPSDPEADPANVYNCRCQLRGVLKNHPYKTNRYSVEGYEEWKKGKKTYTQYLKETGSTSKYGRF